MQPITAFDAALKRAKHLLVLYELLHDSRVRAVRSDWASKFIEIMHWPQSDKIHRVDGKGQDSILIFKDCIGIDRSHFSHEYLSELLRAAVVASIAALDRYLHDIVLHHSIALLNRKEEDIPKELRKMTIPVLATKRALLSLKANKNARPGHILKQAIQEHLHNEYTFQNPDSVQKAAQILGIEDFWSKVATAFNPPGNKKDIVTKLRNIVIRRNQIVHEADLYRKTKAKKLILRAVDIAYAKDVVDWTDCLVRSIDQVVVNEL